MPKPTQQDANLVVQLYQAGSTPEMDEAFNYLLSDQFIANHTEFLKKHPRGSREYSLVRRVLGFYETVGTLHKHGLINEDLLFDWLAVRHQWDRLKDIALGERAGAKNPALWENFEALARADDAWSTAHAQAAQAATERRPQAPTSGSSRH